MDIVDEVTIMDYFSGCVDPLSTEALPCHITQARRARTVDPFHSQAGRCSALSRESVVKQRLPRNDFTARG
jgi:hypothetical protein